MPEYNTAEEPVSLHRRKRPVPAERPPGRPSFPGLHFHLPTPYPSPAPVDLRDFSRPQFAEQIARILWMDHHDGVAFRSMGSVVSATQALRRFDEYLAVCDPEKLVQRLADVTEMHVDGFESWAHARSPVSSTDPYVQLTNLIKLFNCAADHRFSSPRLAKRLSYISIRYPRVDATPHDAYSPFVMQQIRDGARCALADTVMRMTKGKKMPALLGRFYPRLRDLVPFAILIADDCGLPPESIRELRMDCIEELDRTFGLGEISYKKRRRDLSEELYREPVKTRVRWSTGWLVRLLLRLTASTRKHMDPNVKSTALFVGCARGELKSLYIEKHAMAAHLKRYPVYDENEKVVDTLELVRIRKTVKADRYTAVGGDLTRIGDDHTRGVFARSYATIAALKGTHETSIAASLQAGLDDALASTVLSADEEKLLIADPAALAAELGRPEAQVRKVAEGTSDVWLAGCLDFENSPYPGKTLACGAPLWGCLDCRNAIITPSKLPSLIRLLEHLHQQRQEMSESDFKAVYGKRFVRINQIIARFSRDDIEKAREDAVDDSGRNWSLAYLTHIL